MDFKADERQRSQVSVIGRAPENAAKHVARAGGDPVAGTVNA
jgi:hypothetical protein